VIGFTLINAATEADIRDITGSTDTILFSSSSSLNLRANVGATDDVDYVDFYVNDVHFRRESIAPYALGSDTGNTSNPKYNATPILVTAGTILVRAVPYRGGSIGTSREVLLTIKKI